MKARLRWLVGGFALLTLAAFAVSVAVSRPLYRETLDPASLNDIVIAPADEALSFARVEAEGRLHVLLVSQFRGGRVTGVDLNRRLRSEETDPLKLFRAQGYEALRQVSSSIADSVSVPAEALELPFEVRAQNIGVGLSYAEHARESSLDKPPFLFPKFARPTRWTSTLAKNRSTLLDYEGELGFVALEDLAGPAPAPATMGLVLCNEATDRWPLLRGFRRGQPMGTTGFADGKSREGFAPIGPLLLIPRDLETFYRGLELRVYLNGRLRQQARASEMRWGPRNILRAIFEHPGGYRYRDGSVSLLGQGATVAAGTILFSGTPAGVIFKPLNFWNPWLYLQPGDEVVMVSPNLGAIRNRVTD